MISAPLSMENILQNSNQMLGMLTLVAHKSIEMGILKVLQPITVSNGILQPGDYIIDYWFNTDGVFYAATITGFTADNTPVTNQQVPAVPASWVNADGTLMTGTDISACRFVGWCLIRQDSCD